MLHSAEQTPSQLDQTTQPTHERRLHSRATRHELRRLGRYQWLILLIVGVALSLLLQAARIAARITTTHDESISYLAATGHQGSYVRNRPANRWVAALEWKQYWQPDRFPSFRTISSDLARYDIHPPVYFWLLHTWTFLFGSDVRIGRSLNLVFFLLTIPVLLLLARRVLPSSRHNTALVLTWVLSPAVMTVTAEARQYALLGLWSVLFMLLLLRCTERRPSWLILLALGLCTTMGLLTHYHFGILVAAGFVLVTLNHIILRDSKRMISVVLAMTFGATAFVVLHPRFPTGSSSLLQRQAQHIDVGQVIPRCQTAILSLFSLYFPTPLEGCCGVALLSVVLWILVLRMRKRTGLADSIRRAGKSVHRQVVTLFFLVFAALLLLYSLGVSPVHAMGAKYLVMAYPLFAFVPIIMVLRFFKSASTVAIALLCIWQTALGIGDTYCYCARAEDTRSFVSVPGDASCILLDSTAQGVVPVVLWQVPDDLQVFAGSQDALLEEPERFLSGLSPGCVYISDTQYGDTEKKERILLLLDQHGFAVQHLDSDTFGLNELFRINKHAPGVGESRALDARAGKQIHVVSPPSPNPSPVPFGAQDGTWS